MAHFIIVKVISFKFQLLDLIFIKTHTRLGGLHRCMTDIIKISKHDSVFCYKVIGETNPLLVKSAIFAQVLKRYKINVQF
jgi:hypothetical protein